MNESTINQAIKNKAKSVLRKYRKQEEENFHSENLLLLAQTFGTQEEINLCVRRVASMKLSFKGPRFEIPREIERKINFYYQELVKLTK